MLRTDRLSIIPFSQEDGSLLHRMFTDDTVRQYLWDDIIVSEHEVEDILKVNDVLFTKREFGLWKVIRVEDQVVVGFTGLWFFFDEPQPQLLYGLMPDYFGNGYATEVARAIIQYAFDQLGFAYVHAATDPDNTASNKVAERLEMKLVKKRKMEGKMTMFWRIEKDSNT